MNRSTKMASRGFANRDWSAKPTQERRMVLGFVLVAFSLSTCAAVFFLVFTSPSTASTIPEKQISSPEVAPVKMVDVLVAIRDLPPGSEMDSAVLRRESRPQVGITGRVLQDLEQAKGQFSRTLILKGQPILQEMVSDKRPLNAITAHIPEGYRAVTISVDARSSVEGWVRAGANVDVMWLSSIGGRPANRMIVQNAKILSAERQVENNGNPDQPVPSTVTLLVTTDDAAKIQLATTTGSINLSLRGDTDKKGASFTGITVQDLLGNPSSPEAKKRDGSVKVMGPDGTYQELSLVDGKLVR